MKTKRVKVTRPFYFQGQALTLGSTHDLPEMFAIEMRAARKAEIVDPVVAQAASPPEPPMTAMSPTESDPATPETPRGKGGSRNAR